MRKDGVFARQQFELSERQASKVVALDRGSYPTALSTVAALVELRRLAPDLSSSV